MKILFLISIIALSGCSSLQFEGCGPSVEYDEHITEKEGWLRWPDGVATECTWSY